VHVRVYLRLLGYLSPYRLRLCSALACMVLYAAASAVSLGLISPFMRVLFETGTSAQSAPALGGGTATEPGPAGAAAGPTVRPVSRSAGAGASVLLPGPAGPGRLSGLPAPLQPRPAGGFLHAPPPRAPGRGCWFLLPGPR